MSFATTLATDYPSAKWHCNGDCRILALQGYCQRPHQGKGTFAPFPQGGLLTRAMGLLGSALIFAWHRVTEPHDWPPSFRRGSGCSNRSCHHLRPLTGPTLPSLAQFRPLPTNSSPESLDHWSALLECQPTSRLALSSRANLVQNLVAHTVLLMCFVAHL